MNTEQMSDKRFEDEVRSLCIGYLHDCNEYPEEDELLGYVLDCLTPMKESQREHARLVVAQYV